MRSKQQVSSIRMRCKGSRLAKVLSILCFSLLVSACELVPQVAEPKVVVIETPVERAFALCETPQHVDAFAEFCEIDNWFLYGYEVADLSWPQRQDAIEALAEDTPSLIRKIILSQGAETPYQNRLRAQNWVLKLTNTAPSNIQFLLAKLIFENSRQLLEFESAITLLSRVNVRQEKAIEEMKQQLDEKQAEIEKRIEQVEQLLKIETDLSKQNR